MRGYILIPEKIYSDIEKFAEFLNQGYDYVMTLKPK